MIDQDYWNRYYDYWDTFIKEWFDFASSAKCDALRSAMEFGQTAGIALDSLPMPYLGSPDEGVDVVFLNLNPGMSETKDKHDAEGTLQLANIDNGDDGWLIRAFRDRHGASYRSYIKELSPLLQAPGKPWPWYVCGTKWWLGDKKKEVGGRMEWVRRIYKEDVRPERVFALELCPFHSKKWEFGDMAFPWLKEFVCKRGIEPAVVAVAENGLPFAVAVGAAFRDIFDKAGGNGGTGGIVAESSPDWEWSVEKGKNESLKINANAQKLIEANIWPTSGSKPTCRSYKLYKVSCEGTSAKFLCTWAPGGNTAPGDNFRDVEEHICKAIETL